VAGRNGQDLWYIIRQGWVAAALPAPRDEESARAAANVIEGVFAKPGANPMPAWSEEIDGVLLVSAWFRRHPREREKTLQPAEALQRCQRCLIGE
jgi:hypothetical protein